MWMRGGDGGDRQVNPADDISEGINSLREK